MQHPPFNSDMDTLDLYLFSHLQLHHDGTIFNSNDEVISVVDLFVDSRTPQFFADGIEKLPKWWQMIVDLNVDYYPH